MSDLTRAERREFKRERRRERRAKRSGNYESDTFQSIPVIQDYSPPKLDFNNIQAKTEAQGHYLLAIDTNTITFGIGSAGSGKSFIAVAKACEYLESKKVDRIILTRPLVDAESGNLGILPGDIASKVDPYLAPVRELLNQFLGKSKVEAYIKAGKIVGEPLALMRGKTYDRCFIIADEAQNITQNQMKMLLSRIGKWSKMVIDGDEKQSDIKGMSGLADAVRRLQGLRNIGTIEFTREDIVRNDIIRYILERYET